MKRLSILGLFVALIFMVSCTSKEKQTNTNSSQVNIQTVVNKADGLDLKLVGTLLQNGTVTDAASLEKELNKEGGINNLDLDGDNNVDYINVSENKSTNSNVKSFDLTTGKEKDITFIASIEVEKGQQMYNIHVGGNETIYGNQASYTSSHSIGAGELLFYAWLFQPRPYYYHTPYYHGYYPTYYRPVAPVSRTVYTNRTTSQRTVANNTVKKSTTPYKSKVQSTNKGKISPKARTSINNNKTSQKNLSKRNTSKSVNKGGFTKSKSTPNKSSTTKKSSSNKSSTSRSSSRRSSASRSRSRSRSGGRRSDGNFKNNIETISPELALNMVNNLEGVTYYWVDMDNFEEVVGTSVDTSKQVGFIAQNIQEILPEVVESDSIGLTVNYDLIVPVLVQAIKAQQMQIQELESKLSNQ